jgi:pimeloyl-ACP methyl ester carboxylesterase
VVSATATRLRRPPAAQGLTAPGTRAALQELRLPLDTLRWAPQWLLLPRRRTAAPRTLMLLPGFGAGPSSMALLGGHLRRIGHDVQPWGLGRNNGDVRTLMAALPEHLHALARRSGGPIDLVGWSLGGYLARELARDHPDAVRQVVTLGSPVVGGPRFTTVAAWYRLRGHDLALLEREVAERFDVPLRVPVAAVYSKRDGVVAWQACIDPWSPRVRHIEVAETHLGLGFAPRVLQIVAAELER